MIVLRRAASQKVSSAVLEPASKDAIRAEGGRQPSELRVGDRSTPAGDRTDGAESKERRVAHDPAPLPKPAPIDARPGGKVHPRPARRSLLAMSLTALGAALVSVCAIEAWCRWTGSTPTLAEVLSAYGWLGTVSRTYEPGKGFGQLMGYIGGSLIFLTLAYPTRKHLLRFRWLGSLKTWLDVHIFFGITGTAIITLHMAGHLNGLVALCYYATLMAFASGVVGRFLYVHLPRQVSGREQELNELQRETEALATQLTHELELAGVAWNGTACGAATSDQSAGLVSDFRGVLAQRRGAKRALRSLRRKLRTTNGLASGPRKRLEELAGEALRKRRELRSYAMARHLFSSWHNFHLPFTITLFAILAIHVMVAVLFYVEN